MFLLYRDLIHFQTGISPEVGLIAKDYYTGVIGTFSGFFSGNEGGYTYNTLRRSMKNGICEVGGISEEANPRNVETLSCLNPKVDISNYGRAIKRMGTHKGRGHSLFSQLDSFLNEGHIVGIAYNSDGIKAEKHRTSGFFSRYSANHASTIVGRFFDEAVQECTYIIRNTWGTRIVYGLKGPQKDGYHTITESDLSQSLSEITVFK